MGRRTGPRWPAVRRVRPWMRSALAAVRQIVGAPDYGRYLEHHRACHPGRAPMTPRQYYLDFVTRRFGDGSGSPSRCC
jgi:uncharacterized short protein YbdD (DUF466 family)